jgi:hypothetical protein
VAPPSDGEVRTTFIVTLDLAVWKGDIFLDRRRMVIPDELRKCVCFVGLPKIDGTVALVGTAFLMIRPLESLTDRWFSYAATAKHVIEGIRNMGVDSVSLRLNLKGSGATWVKMALPAWIYHPSDPSVDVARLQGSRFRIKWTTGVSRLGCALQGR